MKPRVFVVIMTMLCALLITSCVGGGGGGGGDAVNDLLKMLPRDAEGALYVNTARLDDDDNLSDLRQDVADEWDDTNFYSNCGVRLRDLRSIAFGEVNGDDVFILGELEDLDDLRDELDDQDYDEDEIRGVEVWLDTSEFWEAFAFLPNGSVLVAEEEDLMEDLLRRRDRGGSSMYDEVKGILPDLSADIYMVVGTDSDCYYSRCEVIGFSVEDASSRDFKTAFVLQFESADDADDAFESVEDDAFDSDCDDPRGRRSGSRITIDITCDIDEIAYILSPDFDF